MASEFKLAAILEFANKAGPGVKSAEKDFSGLAKAATAVGAGLTAAGVVAAGKAAYELGVLGAQSLRTKRAFEAISGGALLAADNLDAMRRATRGAMSEQDMMASANQLLQMGLASNAAELEQVTTMATRLGSAMGKEAGPAVQEFALMLANQSIPRLDTFGISASRVRARMLELKEATPGLSREMAFMTATMEQGEAAMERLGDAVEDELLANERLAASWANLKAMAGEALAPAMAEVAEAVVAVTSVVMDAQREVDNLRDEFGDAAVAAAASEDYMYALRDASGSLTDEIWGLGDGISFAEQEIESAGDAMATLQRQAQAFQEQITAGMSPMAQYADGVSGMGTAAGAAAGALDELSTSAKTVAGSFGEMEFDREQLWNMARASGASTEELAELARHMGIATQSEIEHTLEGYKLIEMFGAGEISAEELAAGYRDLRVAEAEMAIEAQIAHDDIETLRGGMQETGEVADRLAESFGEPTQALSEMEQAALDAQAALDRIERDVSINIWYDIHGAPPAGGGGVQEMQTGTAFHRGGWALIGHGGPELVALPRGSRVWPASAPETRAAANSHYSYGGDTVIINDRLAAALYMERRRRERIERVERM